MAIAKRYFEFVEGTSSKFWEVWGDGNVVYTRYGKIGADGQTTMKDQGSPDGAQKLYDKLVKEKTGKGYQEKGGAGAAPAASAATTSGGGGGATLAAVAAAGSGKALAAALEKHLAFLVETPACKTLLAKVCAKAKSAEVSPDGSLTVVMEDRFGDDQELQCSAPTTESLAKATASERRIYAVHDGMSMDTADVGVGLHGFRAGGGGFEQEYLEESEPELFEKAQDKGVEITEVIQSNQDWILENPLKKGKNGEPTLHYFSHEGGGLGKPYPYGIGGVWLRVLAGEILDDEDTGLDAGDDDDDDDGDGDSDDDAGDEGGGEARRFEFSEGTSSKFWEIRVEGDSHTVRYGKIGTDGQTKTKEFASAAEARADADKLIAEKTKKGYEEA